MYNTRDIIELKGRLKKEDCTVQQFQEVGYPYYFQLVDKKLVARHRAIAENNKKLKILTKASTFIREKHGTNELTSEIDKILDSNRIE